MILALALVVACQPKTPLPAAGPNVRATVVTIRETVGQAPSPVPHTYTHALMIANNLARSGDEVDAWRLFDLKKEQVTFVDDMTKTYRVASLKELTTQHREAYAKQPAPELPIAQWIASNERKTINGFDATKSTVKMGGYQRELWIAGKSPIPPQLFAFMRASEPAPSPVAGVARAVDDALLNVRGFPVADHAELPFDNKKLVVDRVVEKIEQKDVPASWFQIPRGYRAAR